VNNEKMIQIQDSRGQRVRVKNAGLDSWDRKAWGRTARTRQLEKTVRMVQAGQEREDRMTRT
jgi:hypothetical protein